MNYKNHKIILFFISIIALCVMLSSACQPTPKETVVSGKNIENTQYTIEYIKTDFPVTYQGSYSDNGANIIFDSIVDLPKSTQLSCYKISAAPFTQSQIDTIIKGLFGDEQLYNLATVTKAELEPEYIQALAELKSKQGKPELYEASEEYYQERVDKIKERIDNALEADTLEPSGYKLKKSTSEKGVKYFSARGDLGKNQMAVIKVSSIDEGSNVGHNSYLEFINGNKYIDITERYPNVQDNEPQNLEITKEEAIDIAYGAIKQLGVENMSYSACGAGMIHDDIGDYPEVFSQHMPQAYLIYFTRVIDGIQVTFEQRRCSFNSNEDNYTSSKFYERIIVAVDDGGISYIRWQGPLCVERVSNDDNLIIPFSRIIELAEKQFSYEYATFENLEQSSEEINGNQAQAKLDTINYGLIISNEIHIRKTVLGLMQIPTRRNSYEYTLVWDFFWGCSSEL